MLGYNDEWIGLGPIDDLYNREAISMENNSMWVQVGDPVLHIELRNWADIVLVAPLSAHTLAKIAHGFCDDLLSCTLRAWDFSNNLTQSNVRFQNSPSHRSKPIILAPAMNTAMWDHPITGKQLGDICKFGSGLTCTHDSLFQDDGVALLPADSHHSIVRVIQPQVKKLACGDVGKGALADLSDIIEITKECLRPWFSLV